MLANTGQTSRDAITFRVTPEITDWFASALRELRLRNPHLQDPLDRGGAASEPQAPERQARCGRAPSGAGGSAFAPLRLRSLCFACVDLLRPHCALGGAREQLLDVDLSLTDPQPFMLLLCPKVREPPPDPCVPACPPSPARTPARCRACLHAPGSQHVFGRGLRCCRLSRSTATTSSPSGGCAVGSRSRPRSSAWRSTPASRLTSRSPASLSMSPME